MSPAEISGLGIAALVSAGVALWVGSAFYCGGIARNNGESYTVWLLIGLAGGPLGLLVAFVYFRNRGERYRRARYSVNGRSDLPEMVRCPNCGETVPLIYGSCHFCGSPVTRPRH